MVRNCSFIIVLFFISCVNKDSLLLREFTKEGIYIYMKKKHIDIDQECGIIDSLKINLKYKTINIKLFIRCYPYVGDFNFDSKKIYKHDIDNAIIKMYHDDNYVLMNNELIKIKQLDSIIKKNKIKEVYIIRNNWDHTDNINKFLNQISEIKNLIVVFEFYNKKYFDNFEKQLKDLKDFPQLPHE